MRCKGKHNDYDCKPRGRGFQSILKLTIGISSGLARRGLPEVPDNGIFFMVTGAMLQKNLDPPSLPKCPFWGSFGEEKKIAKKDIKNLIMSARSIGNHFSGWGDQDPPQDGSVNRNQ